MNMKPVFFALAGIAVFSAQASATGRYTCKPSDRATWKSIDQLKAKMTKDGWKVRFVKEDGGCYEAYGTTPDGKRVEAYFHPITLEKLFVAQRGRVLFEKK